MLETIGFSKPLTEKEVSDNLKKLFPKLDFQETAYNLIKADEIEVNSVDYIVHRTESEYPIRIELWFQDQKHTEAREQFIAKELSRNLNCKTIVGYQEEGSINPYYSLVFDNGKVFLVDDMDTKYADEGEAEIKLIEEIEYKVNWKFDEYGLLV